MEHQIILETEVDCPDDVQQLLERVINAAWKRKGWNCPVRSTFCSPTMRGFTRSIWTCVG